MMHRILETRLSHVTIFLAFFIPAFVTLASPASTYATFPGQNGIIVYTKEDGKHYKSSVDMSNEEVVPWNDYRGGAMFSPDGQHVLYPYKEAFKIADTGSTRAAITSYGYGVPSMWDKSGLKLFYSSCYTFEQTQCSVRRTTLGGEYSEEMTRFPAGLSSLEISPKSNQYVALDIYSEPTKVMIQRAFSGQNSQATLLYASTTESGMYGSLSCPTWSPDGAHVAVWQQTAIRGKQNLLIINPSSGDISVSHSFEGFPRCPVWSPDGTMVIFSADKNITPYYMNHVADNAMISINISNGMENRILNNVTDVSDWQAITTRTGSIYRFWSDEYRHHFYTSSSEEAFHVATTYPDRTWRYEGEAYTAPSCTTPNTKPVYRFWSDTYKGHFFTSDAGEKDYVIAHYPPQTWRYEGEAFYVIN